MAPPAVEGGGQGGQQPPQQPQQGRGGFSQTVTGIIRVAVFWYFAARLFSSNKPTTDPSSSSSSAAAVMSNLFQQGQPLDMWLYLSEDRNFKDFGSGEGSLLAWHETSIPYASWGPHSTRSLTLKYHPSQALKQHNGSLYAHVFFAHSGYSPDPDDPEYKPQAAFGRTHPVVRYLPKTRADKRRSLLGSSPDSDEGHVASEVADVTRDDYEDNGPVEWVSYWKPNITINLVADFTQYTQNGIPPNIAPRILRISIFC